MPKLIGFHLLAVKNNKITVTFIQRFFKLLQDLQLLKTDGFIISNS